MTVLKDQDVKTSISVVILTYNSEKWINKCLGSLAKELSQDDEIIVVDNHSEDKTIESAKQSGLKIKFIRNTKNLGFSRGINLGIKHTKKKCVLVTNPDTIIHPGAIGKLMRCLVDCGAHIAGSKLEKDNGKIHNSFVRKPDLLTGIFDFTNLRKVVPGDYFHKKHYYLEEGFPTKTKEVDAVSGAFMLVDKVIFDKLGYFDENFFMYLEDVDFCIRARSAGYRVIFCPKSIVFHQGGASSGNKDKINHRAWSNSRRYYFKKHFSKIQNIIIQPLFILDDVFTKIWLRLK